MPRLDMDYIKWVHKFCGNNRTSLSKSSKCGCFDCIKIFSPMDISDWIDKGQTARCPYCGVDSIIGDNDVPRINELFLQAMNKAWCTSAILFTWYLPFVIQDLKEKREVSLRPSLSHPSLAEIIRMDICRPVFTKQHD
jgi:DNA-directed RNA polymerase subunit RPC12/RpoP